MIPTISSRPNQKDVQSNIRLRTHNKISIASIITLFFILLPYQISSFSTNNIHGFQQCCVGKQHSFHKIRLPMAPLYESKNTNHSSKKGKSSQRKPKRRFAQSIDPRVSSSSSTTKSKSSPVQKMDDTMQNFMKNGS